eukprot:scaffold28800_cov45-Phaeocystis_antarctica.AAC.1
MAVRCDGGCEVCGCARCTAARRACFVCGCSPKRSPSLTSRLGFSRRVSRSGAACTAACCDAPSARATIL